ncbi:MAG: CBS domain-containing protein [Betaproteobacteria bacterium]|nr:CBS domain-containing protein [Betaproteobacteria bacterium]
MPNRPVSRVIENREFLTAVPTDDARSVARHMRSHGAGAVLVVDEDGGRLLGICTERDLAYKLLAEGLDPDATAVAEIMTRDPQTVSPERPFGHVLHMMFEGGFRHMPVTDAFGRPLGIVSARDALGLEIFSFREELKLRETLAEIL